MKRHVQAALRSGLICPGAGQWFLGQRRRALLFALPTLVAAIAFMAHLVAVLFPPMQKIADDLMLELLSGGTADIGALMTRVHQLAHTDAAMLSPAVYVIVAMWAASIIDAWLLGR
jgi:hypothetical protein